MKITGKYEQASKDPKIALSPNAEVIVIASANSLAFYSTMTGQLDTTIESVFNGKILISFLTFLLQVIYRKYN